VSVSAATPAAQMSGREALAPLIVAVVGVGVVCGVLGDVVLIFAIVIGCVMVARTEPAHALAGARVHGVFIKVAEVRGAWTWLGGANAVAVVLEMALV
jgi:hypothetical protein